MLENWLPDPDPDAYGAFENDRLIGFVEGYLEKWIGRYWITNLHILDTQNAAQESARRLWQEFRPSPVSPAHA